MDNDQGLRRSIQGRHPRGRHPRRRRTQGPRLLLPHRRPAQVLPRSQEALRQHQGRRRSRLPTPPLRLVRQAPARASSRDFEEFAVYDCRVKPVTNDPPPTPASSTAPSTEYAEKWDEIAAIFSRDAVLKGSFDKYAESTKGKKGTAEVDADFLEEIESWRDTARPQPRPAQSRALPARTQFRRPAHHRPHHLPAHLRGPRHRGLRPPPRPRQRRPHLPAPLELFRAADARYNSGLFHFPSEKGRHEDPDELTLPSTLDDKLLQDIITPPLLPDSPYEFSVLPADILGQVYEQFLGKVIRLTAGHRAVVEDKPEVKKAGGVYYTPTYIVDYIVADAATVGPPLDGLKRQDRRSTDRRTAIAASSILDPACGSGSFLIGAYQFLLDWHRDCYIAHDPEKLAKGNNAGRSYQAGGGGWKLTIAERKRILLNNIFGVDIDTPGRRGHQALAAAQSARRRNRPEPPARTSSRNAPCPTSATTSSAATRSSARISTSTADAPCSTTKNATASTSSTGRPSSPNVFKHGGFDAVIGNPPYVRQESIKEMKAYLSRTYDGASNTADLYVYFLEKAVRLLREGGIASYIVSSSFLKAAFAASLRKTIKKHVAVVRLTDFGGLPVFTSAKDTYVCIPVLKRIPQPERIHIRRIVTLEPTELNGQLDAPGYDIPHERFGDDEWALRTDIENILFTRLCSAFPKLGESLSALYYGVKTGLNECFQLSPSQAHALTQSADQDTTSFIKRIFGGQQTRRYTFSDTDEYLIVIPSGWTRKHFPAALTEENAWTAFSTRNSTLAAQILPSKRCPNPSGSG